MSRHIIQIGIRKLRIWPEKQALLALDEPTVKVTRFDDVQHYHPGLKRRTLELLQDPAFRDFYFHGGCGTKVRHVADWARPEAELIQERAIALFRQVHPNENAVVDDSWASVYERGDYCMPHSHNRSVASVLYVLDPGDQDLSDNTGGKFCFADPRIKACCQLEEGRMTQLLVPTLHEGTMMLFPSEWVHLVTPYAGTRPRITISWNIHTRVVPGKPQDALR